MTELSAPSNRPRARIDRAHTPDAALESHYRFVLWLVPTVERFPRRQKFLLGDRIQTIGLDVLEQLIGAAYTPPRRPSRRGEPGP